MRVYATGARTPFNSPGELIGTMRRIAREENVILQAFDANAILCREQVVFSFFHAFKAFESGKALAKSVENEWLLRAAATRKIDEALERVGVKDPKAVVIGIAVAPAGARGGGTGGKVRRVLKLFGAVEEKKLLEKSDAEREKIARLFNIRWPSPYPLEELLLEKIALAELE